MACFLVPTAEAIVTTVISKVVSAKEKKQELSHVDVEKIEKKPFGFGKKLKWLNAMLWGGSALLAFEHVWHGEVTPFFPFLTAASNPADAADMLHEMATSGVAMAGLVTLVWVGMVIVSGLMERRAEQAAADTQEV